MQRATWILHGLVWLALGSNAAPASAMGTAPKPLPGACDVLKAVDTKAVLGDSPTLELRNDNSGDGMRMSVCAGDNTAGGQHLQLLVKAAIEMPSEQGAVLRDTYVASVNKVANPPLKTEYLAIGEAAVWAKEVGQLTFWTHQGRLMIVLSGRNGVDLSSLETVAREIVAVYP